jgi:hypothetical protein
MASEAVVEKRHDDWVEVPAETESGAQLPIRLRPGANEEKVRISPTLMETEVSLVQLRQGLGLIEEEHQR